MKARFYFYDSNDKIRYVYTKAQTLQGILRAANRKAAENGAEPVTASEIYHVGLQGGVSIERELNVYDAARLGGWAGNQRHDW